MFSDPFCQPSILIQPSGLNAMSESKTRGLIDSSYHLDGT